MKKSIGTAALLGAMCLAVMPAAPAYAANWVYVTTSNQKADFYYDSDTIQRSGNIVTVWEKYDLSRVATTKERTRISRYRYDCAERTSTLLASNVYYPNGEVKSFTYKAYEQEEEAVAPDTVTEAVLEAVCQ
jgi:hypothetical protein